MKILLLLVIIALAFAVPSNDNDQLIRKDFVRSLKAIPKTWEVEDWQNNKFRGWTVGQLKDWLGTYQSPRPNIQLDHEYVSLNAPDNWDWRKESDCVSAVRDQQNCGSCWAFGATGSLTDRFCIDRGMSSPLSPEDLVVCDKGCFGCQGGFLGSAFRYLERTGAVLDTCLPYVSGDGETFPECPTHVCADPAIKFKKYQCQDGSVKHFRKIIFSIKDKMKDEIMKGPVEASFTVYKDFMSYKSGIYKHTTGEQLGGRN
jgi:cathepsin B